MNATNDDAYVEFDRVSKHFEDDRGRVREDSPPVLNDVSFSVKKGEFFVVVGPSGCGKSTMLRILAGLEIPTRGEVRMAGRSMRDVAPQDRDLAMVFQGYALYPHMTVRENIEFPLKMRKVNAKERAARASEVADLLHLSALMDRLPPALSGGERQRVAMGRAIVRRTQVFLFDEPLSNLDAALRQELRVELGALVRRLGVTAIYVTHDQVEAMTLADRICVIKDGSIQQIASPRQVYETPANGFVAGFLGSPPMNFLEARAVDSGVEAGPFRLNATRGSAERLVVGIRPNDVHLAHEGETGAAPFDVLASETLGADTHHTVRSGDVVLCVRVEGFDARPPGSQVYLRLNAKHAHLFEGRFGRRLS
jgi:multiple sugar transport system ATP-binding protein